MNILEKFGRYAGYKLNMQKMYDWTCNYTPPKHIREKFHLNWDQKSLNYLGIYLTKEHWQS